MGPLNFGQSLLSHHMATVALHGNQNQLSPPVNNLGLSVHWHRIPKSLGSRYSFKFTRPLPSMLGVFSFCPPTTGARSSNTSKDKAADTGSTKAESGPLGVMVGRVGPTSDSWFLDPCQTATEETTLSPIGQCLYLILEDAPEPHRLVSPSWCHKGDYNRPFQCSLRLFVSGCRRTQ